MKSTPPEKVSEALWPRGRDGGQLDPQVLMEARRRSLPPAVAAAAAKRRASVDKEFDRRFLGDGKTNGKR